MPHKAKPKPIQHSKGGAAKQAAPKGQAIMENKAQNVSQAGSTPVPVEASHPAGTETTTLTQYAVDPQAAIAVEAERNLRIERARAVPYTAPEMPPGLSPNEKVSLFVAGYRGEQQQPDEPPPGDGHEGEGGPGEGGGGGFGGRPGGGRPGRP